MPTEDADESALYEAFCAAPNTRLIAPAQDGVPNVEFKHGGGWRECRIWEGYFDASLILLKKALERQQDANLIFPALFNLRHGMEIALKWHIQHAGGVVPKRAGHNLDILIEALRKSAQGLNAEETFICDHFLNCILELATIDPRSVAFRYSAEINGSPIEIKPDTWDLRNLYFQAENLALWFDNLSGQIDLSQDEEYEAYRRGG